MIGRTILVLPAAMPLAALAQQPGRVRRIGLLANSTLTAPDAIAIWEAFRQQLQHLGWTEGRQIQFLQRFADGVPRRYPALVRELIDAGVELILATGGESAPRAAMDATSTIPIVFVYVSDPVEAKLVDSLARPGGNLTGLATMSSELIGKRLELLKDAFPRARRIAYLTAGAPWAGPTALAAVRLGLQWHPVELAGQGDLAGAISGQSDADAWFVEEHALTLARRADIVSLLARQRKPAMYPASGFVHSGGLMSYGVDFVAQSRRAAWFVDRILRGARPADIPVEQPTQLELVVNLKTARAQGIAIPQSILLRASEVIE